MNLAHAFFHFRRKHDAMTPHNLFSLLVERLMLNTDKLTMATYNVLFEVEIRFQMKRVIDPSFAKLSEQLQKMSEGLWFSFFSCEAGIPTWTCIMPGVESWTVKLPRAEKETKTKRYRRTVGPFCDFMSTWDCHICRFWRKEWCTTFWLRRILNRTPPSDSRTHVSRAHSLISPPEDPLRFPSGKKHSSDIKNVSVLFSCSGAEGGCCAHQAVSSDERSVGGEETFPVWSHEALQQQQREQKVGRCEPVFCRQEKNRTDKLFSEPSSDRIVWANRTWPFLNIISRVLFPQSQQVHDLFALHRIDVVLVTSCYAMFDQMKNLGKSCIALH